MNPENPSPSATPAKSSSPVTLIWSPGNISSIAVQVPTEDSLSVKLGRQILGHESFTRWLIGTRKSERVPEQMFYYPNWLLVQKVKMTLITAVKFQVSPPSISVLTIQTVSTD